MEVRIPWRAEIWENLRTRLKTTLKQRKIIIVVKDDISERKEVKSGVPQGSVLAPIIFLVYVNDRTRNKQMI